MSGKSWTRRRCANVKHEIAARGAEAARYDSTTLRKQSLKQSLDSHQSRLDRFEGSHVRGTRRLGSYQRISRNAPVHMLEICEYMKGCECIGVSQPTGADAIACCAKST